MDNPTTGVRVIDEYEVEFPSDYEMVDPADWEHWQEWLAQEIEDRIYDEYMDWVEVGYELDSQS